LKISNKDPNQLKETEISLALNMDLHLEPHHHINSNPLPDLTQLMGAAEVEPRVL